MTETVDRVGGPILLVIVIAFVAYVLLRIVGRRLIPTLIRRLGGVDGEAVEGDAAGIEKRKRVATIGALVDWLFRLLIVGGATIAILIVLDLNIVIVAILVMIAVIGLVAKDVIRDYVAGVIILLENQFAIGDWVRIAGEYGEVEAISLRRTLLRTAAGDVVTVPNGDLRVVTNRTKTWGRINIDVGIEDPTQLDLARATIDEVGRQLAEDPAFQASVLEPPRLVSVSDISDRGIRLVVQGKVDARGRFPAESAFRERMLRALDAAGVELVTAQRMQMIEVPSSAPAEAPRP